MSNSNAEEFKQKITLETIKAKGDYIKNIKKILSNVTKLEEIELIKNYVDFLEEKKNSIIDKKEKIAKNRIFHHVKKHVYKKYAEINEEIELNQRKKRQILEEEQKLKLEEQIRVEHREKVIEGVSKEFINEIVNNVIIKYGEETIKKLQTKYIDVQALIEKTKTDLLKFKASIIGAVPPEEVPINVQQYIPAETIDGKFVRRANKTKPFTDFFNNLKIVKVEDIINYITNYKIINVLDINGDNILTWVLQKAKDETDIKKKLKYLYFAKDIILQDYPNLIDLDHKNNNKKNALIIAKDGGFEGVRISRNNVPIMFYLEKMGVKSKNSNKFDEKYGRCLSFITDKDLLYSTSSSAGLPLCQVYFINRNKAGYKYSPVYVEDFLNSCVTYYSNYDHCYNILYVNNNPIDDKNTSLINYISDITNKLKNIAKNKDTDTIIDLRTELKSLLLKYKTLKFIYLKEDKQRKILIKKLISDIFTSWVKFIFPIGADTIPTEKVYKLFLELSSSFIKKTIELYNPTNESTIYDLIMNNKNNIRFIKNTNILWNFIFHMIFYLKTPDQVFKFELEMLQKYKILKIYKPLVPIQNQKMIMALLRDFDIASIDSSFPFIYRIPYEIPNGKCTITDFPDDDPSWKPFKFGVKTIISLMKTTSKHLKEKYFNKKTLTVLTAVSKTAYIRSKLAETDTKRAFYIFYPSKSMFYNNQEGVSAKHYVFHDMLCNQIFQEYTSNMDKEHLITSAKLRYLCNYAVTRPATQLFDKNFKLIYHILNFALNSFFIQNQLTAECNRAAGTKERWTRTVDEYENLLTFICQLYCCKAHNKTDLEVVMNGKSKTVETYIKEMIENSVGINKNTYKINNLTTEFVTNFLEFPTIILNESIYHFTLQENYDKSVQIIGNIGNAMLKLVNNDDEIFKTLEDMFEDYEQIRNYSNMQDKIVERVQEFYIENKSEGILFPPKKSKFGDPPNQKQNIYDTPLVNIVPKPLIDSKINEENTLILKVPLEDTVNKRIRKLNKLVHNPKTSLINTIIDHYKKLN
jgi:hypothetical protein